MTIMGFPPAGGWVTLNKIIKPTPKPTAKGIVIKINAVGEVDYIYKLISKEFQI